MAAHGFIKIVLKATVTNKSTISYTTICTQIMFAPNQNIIFNKLNKKVIKKLTVFAEYTSVIHLQVYGQQKFLYISS